MGAPCSGVSSSCTKKEEEEKDKWQSAANIWTRVAPWVACGGGAGLLSLFSDFYFYFKRFSFQLSWLSTLIATALWIEEEGGDPSFFFTLYIIKHYKRKEGERGRRRNRIEWRTTIAPCDFFGTREREREKRMIIDENSDGTRKGKRRRRKGTTLRARQVAWCVITPKSCVCVCVWEVEPRF
jgi:hypothetical protein